MQTVFVVHKNDRESAEALESMELSTNIRLCSDEPNELYQGYEAWLARYGLICQYVLELRGFKDVVDQRELLEQLKGDDTRPRWCNRFIKQHRGALVLLGWIRYFNERGVTGNWCRESYLVGPMDHVREASGPVDLGSRFMNLDSRCQDLPEASRPYSDFTESPSAFQLYPC